MAGELDFDLGISDFVQWNVDYGGAPYFYPVDCGLLVVDCYSDQYAKWIGRTYNARLAIDEGVLPKALLAALEAHYDPAARENLAMHIEERWASDPEFDFYGKNFYTIGAFRAVVRDFRAASGQDVFCLEVAKMLDAVIGRAVELDAAAPRPGFGVMVTGP